MRGDKPSLTAIGLVGFYVALILLIVVGFAAFEWRPELASTTPEGSARRTFGQSLSWISFDPRSRT